MIFFFQVFRLSDDEKLKRPCILPKQASHLSNLFDTSKTGISFV